MKRSLCVVVALMVAGFAGMATASGGTETWEIVQQLEVPAKDLQGMPHSLSPDGELLLTASNESGICLYRAEDLSPLGCFKPEVKTDRPLWLRIPTITWAPDGSYVVFTTADTRSWKLNASSGELEFLLASAPGEYFAFSPDGKRLAVGGGGAIVVAPPGALAEAPVARYEGILKGLVWCEAGLYYGVLAPDRKTFQIWVADPTGLREPALLWSYPYPMRLLDVSPDGRFAWVGSGLVDLVTGEVSGVRKATSLDSFVFSADGAWWLYSYSTVIRDETIRMTYRLAIRSAETSEDEEKILYEGEKQIVILGWAPTGRVALFLVHRDEPEVLILKLLRADG